jgi:hypothetical protein
MAEAKGDCYEVALHLVLEDKDLVLVHGWPVGQPGGTAIPGERYGHAWVERTTSVTFPANDDHPEMHAEFVDFIDKSNGNDRMMPAAMAYNIGHLDEEHIARYSHDEALAKMVEYKHYGPWDEAHPPLPDWAEDDDDYYECLECGERFADPDDHECEEDA